MDIMDQASSNQTSFTGDIPTTGFNTFNYVKAQCFSLTRVTAKVEAHLQFVDGIHPTLYKTFYTTLSELFKLTKSIISEEMGNDINEWLYPKNRRTQPTREDAINGVNIANKFLSELEERGLNKLMDEPPEPAFMLEDETT